jgi:hypothetical protein
MRTLTNGITLKLLDAVPAGKTGRGWEGNQCSYELRSADGSGKPLVLGADTIPPFTSIYSVVRRGSAAFIGVQFNGYAHEFPRGGCRVLAVDLCEGRVIWKSSDYTSNGDIVLIGNDYLLTGYGFTSEKRIIQVHDAHSGKVLQTLKIPGNPEALDFNQGVLTVKTNHGDATFELLR